MLMIAMSSVGSDSGNSVLEALHLIELLAVEEQWVSNGNGDRKLRQCVSHITTIRRSLCATIQTLEFEE